jgi:phage gp37-like protein
MGIIATIEDAILAVGTAALGNTVRKIETVPGGWTMATLTRALQFAPGVYVAFHGAVPGASEGYYNGRFTVYMVSKGASEEDRRRGNNRIIGAYEMLERMLPPLSVLTVQDIGSPMVTGIENLFRDAMFELGGTVYSINLTMPNMPFDYRLDESGLANFVLFHAEAYNEDGIAAEEDPLIIGEQQLYL